MFTDWKKNNKNNKALVWMVAFLVFLCHNDSFTTTTTTFVSCFSTRIPLQQIYPNNNQPRSKYSSSSSSCSNYHPSTICFFSSSRNINNNINEEGTAAQPTPTSFREAEILGLRLMQENLHMDALKVFELGLTLPGSKMDIIRTKNISGPSPVGGSAGGTEGKVLKTLDEFEKQAAYYNMACACANLGKVEEAVDNLKKSYENGFDNIDTMTSDPDLRVVQESESFQEFLKQVKRPGFFGLFR